MTPRLLIIEDEVAILDALKHFFVHQGFSVHTASEREEAEGLLADHAYDAVIADLRLSGSFNTDGLEIVRFLRKHRPDVKVILLTAYGSPEVEAEAERLGVDAFLHKPMPLAEIADRVKSLLNLA
jgi:two-component system, response regulator, stage 0 sporulation protein F